MKVLRQYLIAIVAAALAGIVVRVFIIQSYRISGPALAPRLLTGDHVFVVKTVGGLFPIRMERGKTILLTDEHEGGRNVFRNIVGLPGDTVEIRNGTLLINGSTSESGGEKWSPDFPSTIVPANQVLVLPKADLIALDSIQGEARWVWLSIIPASEKLDPEKTGRFFSRLRWSRIFRKVESSLPTK